MYTAKLPEDCGWRERLEWCKEQFGPVTAMSYGNAWLKDARWWRLNNLMCFRNEQDLTLYLLRWA